MAQRMQHRFRLPAAAVQMDDAELEPMGASGRREKVRGRDAHLVDDGNLRLRERAMAGEQSAQKLRGASQHPYIVERYRGTPIAGTDHD